jgi:hypothetical protein
MRGVSLKDLPYCTGELLDAFLPKARTTFATQKIYR